MKVWIVEDKGYEDLFPLTLLRASFELRCGATTLEEKLTWAYGPATVRFACREDLATTLRERKGSDRVNAWDEVSREGLLLLNGRWLCMGQPPSLEGPDEAMLSGEEVLYLRLNPEKTRGLAPVSADDLVTQCLGLCKARRQDDQAILIRYPWNLIHHNPKAIEFDFASLASHAAPPRRAALPEQVAVLGDPAKVWVAPSASLQPFSVLDARGGPIIIDEKAVVSSFTRVEGPAFLGRGVQTFAAMVREGCSIGPYCRVGGEIEESIFHAYANKYHDGFIGHSYICEWVNLGALTTNSDLKNDYTAVEVTTLKGSMSTGDTKVGSFIGDHTKTSIGTLLNTGTSVGVMCNLVATGGVLPKFIPSFSWYLGGKITKGFGLEAGLDTARKSMSRRDVVLTEAMVELLRKTRDHTKAVRDEMVRKDRRKG